MEQRLSVITLGVADLGRSTAFYEQGLGWEKHPISNETISFFQAGAMIVGLFPKAELAKNSGQDAAQDHGFQTIILSHNVRHQGDVASVLAEAERAGGRIVNPAEKQFWGGFAGHFADLDGHIWEVAHNPSFPLADDGAISLP